MKKRFLFGEWWDHSTPLSVKDVEIICQKAHQRKKALATYPMDKIFRILEKLQKVWADPQFPKRKELEKKLVETTGFSKAMLSLAFNELQFILDPEVLKQKLKTECRNIAPYGTAGVNSKTQTSLSWHPLGVLLHVLSGNVFLVGIGSFLEGILTRNVSFLKMSSSETDFMPAFIQTLQEVDTDGVVSGSLALIDYRSSQKDVIAAFQKNVDGIVVWGGEDAVRAYRSDLPARSRLVVFGPKLSLAVITQSGVRHSSLSGVAKKLATEISIWDQNACTAPQACFVQTETLARKSLTEVDRELSVLSKTLPAGSIGLNHAVEIQKWRGIAEISEARGEGVLKTSKGNVDYTVILDRKQTIDPSPLHRTLRLIPFESMDEIKPELERLQGYIQTIGLSSSAKEQLEWEQAFSTRGALRILPLGSMNGGEIDDPHDGSYDLPQLMHLVVSRYQLPEGITYPLEIIPTKERQEIISERLRTLCDQARKSSFYKKQLAGSSIESVSDITQIPLLSRQTMEANIETGLKTGKAFGGYVTRSGGSTGKPKFSIYDSVDWDHLVTHGVIVFENLGMKRGDRVANFMMAGDLYGSFVSFDHINERLGAQTFGFAHQTDPTLFLEMWQKFKINVVQGIPTTLMPMLRKVKKLDPDFTLETVIYAGSPLSEADRIWAKEKLKAKRVSSVIGANDGGQFAFQCDKLSGRLHHTLDEFNFVEIVDSTGSTVPDGQEGDIVITSLLKFAYPLIRYEVGDRGRIVKDSCACGRTRRVFEYLGRTGDSIVTGYLNISYRDIADMWSSFPITQLQMATYAKEEGEYLEFRVESADLVESDREKMDEVLLTKAPKIKEALDNQTLRGADIILFQPGELPRNKRSGKISQVVDER